jgi:hypothetical protein
MLEVYQQMGFPAPQSTTLQGYFVEMYSALKQGICAFSLMSGAPKCPTKVENNDNSELALYVEALFAMLQSNKKFQLKKWWSVEVTEQLLKLHLEYNKAYGGNNKQDAERLNSQKQVVKGMFEMDRKIVRMK